MENRYGIAIPLRTRATLVRWATEDPVDFQERARTKKVAKQMGWQNPFVKCTP